MLYALGDRKPIIRGDYFIAPGAHVMGSVDIGERASVWFNVVIRADNDWVIIGEETNIQDGSVLHVDPDSPLTIGSRVVIGHKVMLHSCTIGDGSLIGMNAVILNGAKIGKGCLIGANTLIPENMEIPDGSLVVGSPGKIKRSLTPEQRAGLLEGAKHYMEKAQLFKTSLKPFDPMP